MKKFLAIAVVGSSIVLAAQGGLQAPIEWPYWGGDAAQTKYSAAAEITPANVNELEPAWTWEVGEAPLPQYGMRPGAFETTPLMIDNVLYVSTSYHRVVALNAETGKQLWVFDPKSYEQGQPIAGTGPHRGLAFWRDGKELRIFLSARYLLFAIDAKTGQPLKQFGGGNGVMLHLGHTRDIPREQYQQTSPPIVYGNLVIVGSRIPDRLQYKNDPPGSVQAFDARTGKRAWIFYTVPQSAKDFGADTWGNESWKNMGHANVWGPMALDEARGLVYVASSTPSGDYWGGRRPGANLFAESLICLDAKTGQRKWHFQAVHHGLWDYDFASPPTLGTITVNGRKIDAVAQPSKQGFTYVFDRVTGQPVWPIEERPVDTNSEIPGEVPYPTQPFPTKPPAFAPQGISLDDANDLTPEIKALATIELGKYKLGPLFTLPTFRGTLQRPSNNGAANWGGGAFDPDTGMFYLHASDAYYVSEVCKNDASDPYVDMEYGNFCGSTGLFQLPRSGATPAPAAPTRQTRESDGEPGRGGGSERPSVGSNPLGPIPLTKPPYAHVVAIDLNKGDIAWRVPFGEGSSALRNHRLLKGVTLPARLGTPGNNAGVVTKGGLYFIGGGDPYLYAFDKTTGRELWRGATAFRTSGNAMTYKARNGRQYVVIATGAGPDATLVGFALRSKTGGPSPASTTSAGRAGGAVGGAPTVTISGETGYANVCAACHGPRGQGGGAAPSLLPMTRGNDEVLGIVREGLGQMPPVSRRELTDEQIGQVADYLRSLGTGGR